MTRPIALAIAAIILFGVGAAVFVVILPGDGTGTPDEPVAPAAAPGVASYVGATPGPMPLPKNLPPIVPVEPPVYGPPRPVAEKGTWESVPPSARANALGNIGGGVGRELNELHPEIEACFDETTQARFGRQAVSRTQDYAPMDDTGTTILLLHLETQHEGVRIVDAPVEVQGSASDGLIACAQQVLRGRVLQVPGATPGAKHRLVYPLTP
ncbi:MAG TPA: hypothetical protein PLL32_09685 [Anaeromyxobacteraceae bacterium]|nr:hypothetical protein [Anaeromyxobacteraceae bacterium]